MPRIDPEKGQEEKKLRDSYMNLDIMRYHTLDKNFYIV